MVITLPRTAGDVGEMLSSTLATDKWDNRRYLLKVAETIKFLARRGIPFHCLNEFVSGIEHRTHLFGKF